MMFYNIPEHWWKKSTGKDMNGIEVRTWVIKKIYRKQMGDFLC